MTDGLLQRALDGARLSVEEGVRLFELPLLELADAADARCRHWHADTRRSFVIGRNINYTNICVSGCTFCAFFRGSRHPQSYLLSIEQVLEKIRAMVQSDGTEVLLQGGLHPHLRLNWFEELFRAIRDAYPTVQLHALSPTEIVHLASRETMPTITVLRRLQAAGLQSIPGGGAEILVDRVRQQVSPRKCSADDWLQVMREAHQIGLPSTATMMYGHLETRAERIEHLARLRALHAETGGFLGFIPWPFQHGTTRLSTIMRAQANDVMNEEPSSSLEFLRMLAVSRLFLDNFAHLQSSWVTQGLKVGQLGLCFGADDLGSTMMEEQVVSAAGVTYRSNAEELARLIRDCGFQAWQRNTSYDMLRCWDDGDSAY